MPASEAYALRFAGPVGRWFLERQGRIVRDMLDGLDADATVLDVGGGHAQLVPFVLGAGHRLVVAGSRPWCGRRLTARAASGQLEYRSCDLMRLPWPDGSFDAVVSVRMLAHVEDWRDFVGELCRVARRRVIVDYTSAHSLSALPRGAIWLKRRVERDARTYRSIRPGVLRDAFHESGFDVSHARPQYVLPMALHRALGIVSLSRRFESGMEALGLTARLGSPVLVRADRAR